MDLYFSATANLTLKVKFIRVAVAFMFAISTSAEATEDAQLNNDDSDSPVFFDGHPKLLFDSDLSDTHSSDQPLPLPDQTNLPAVTLGMERKIYSFEGLETAPENFEHLSQGEVVIEGDKMDVHMGRQYRAIGNASIHQKGQSIFGNTIEYDSQDDKLHVVGDARIISPNSTIKGSELEMTLGDTVGEMKNSSFVISRSPPEKLPEDTSNNPPLQTTSLISQNLEEAESTKTSPQYLTYSRGDASSIEFEGEDIRRFKDARYTTCDPGRDDWYLRAGEMEINDYEKSATATNAWVQFKGTPILYTPWIDFSFHNQRKSGFLAPTFGTTSRSGFEFQVPYYWNIAPDMDATLGARALSRRGLQLQGEFRYLDENYNGINNAEYLPGDSLSNSDRYYVKLQHRHALGAGWSAGYDLEKVSDDEYFSELSTRITVTSRINLLQQAYVNYGDEVWSFNGLVQKFQTLDDVSFPYERLPQLTLNGNKDWNYLNTNLQSQFVRFDKNTQAPDTLVTGNRLSFYPSITIPMEKPYGFIRPKFGLHYSRYNLDNDYNLPETDISRSVPIFSLDTGLFFERKMRVVKHTYTQTLEPRMYYVYIPNRNQDNIPIFDTTESDLNLGSLFQENQFTGGDRINNANQLSLALSTRMIDADTGVQRLAATIGQRYFFSDQKVSLPNTILRDRASSDIVGAATLYLTNKWNIDAIWQYNTDTAETVRNSFGARYNPEPGKALNFGYRFTQDRLEQINISGQWPMGQGWYGMGRWNYSLRDTAPIEGLAGIEYDAGCWQARGVLQRVSTATADANYALFFQLELGGLASIGSNPLRLLQRGIPGYTSTGQIPDSFKQKSYNDE